MIDVQLQILFLAALAFAILYEVYGRSMFCAMSWITWWVLSLFWVYGSAELYAPLALLPVAFGWIYLIRLILDIIDFTRSRRWDI